MARYQLHTLGRTALEGPNGPVAFTGAKATALIAMLAVAGTAGVHEDELLLRLTPESTPEAGRAELGRLVAEVNDRLDPGAIVRRSRGYGLIPGSVEMDVTVHATDRSAPEPRFLADLGFAPAPELDEWIASTRRRVAAIHSSNSGAAANPRSARNRGSGTDRSVGWTVTSISTEPGIKA